MAKMNYTQDNRPAKISTPLGKDKLLLQSFTGREELAKPFSYEANCLSEDAGLDIGSLIGKSITITLAPGKGGKGSARYFNGICTGARQLASATVLAGYRLTIEPWFALLRHSATCRIFQNKKLPDILRAVFSATGFQDFKLSLSGAYSELPFCVQYNESDFDFVSRLLEQAGAYYFFKHSDGKHEMQIVDAMSAHATGNGVSSASFIDGILGWESGRQFVTGKAAVNAYDFKKPRGKLLARKAVAPGHPNGDLQKYTYRASDYFQTSDGDNLAKTLLESEQAEKATFDCQSLIRGLAAGYTFSLKDCPIKAQNQDYLITSCTVEIQTANYSTGKNPEEVYHARLNGIPKSSTFRPRQDTPRPVVYGLQPAVVVGKSGEEIWTDEYRRVKVQFVWDQDGKSDEKSSCWLRVAQIWASKKFGAIFTPRVGDEVLVEFIGGNPDRPIVVGSLYNDVNKPAYDSSQPEVSGIKTNSSKGGGGFNELRFNDKKDKEELFIQAQKDMKELVNNDRNVTIKHDLIGVIEHDHTDTVKHDQKLTVENDRIREVKHDETIKIANNRGLKVENNLTDKVGNDHSLSVGGNDKLSVSGNRSGTVSGSESWTVSGDRSDTVSGQETASIAGNRKHSVGGAESLTVTGAQTLKVSQGRTTSITMKDTVTAQEISLTGQTKITLTVGASSIELSPTGITLSCGASKFSLQAAQASLESVQTTVKGTGTAELSASGMTTVKGAMLTLKGDGVLQANGGVAMIN